MNTTQRYDVKCKNHFDLFGLPHLNLENTKNVLVSSVDLVYLEAYGPYAYFFTFFKMYFRFIVFFGLVLRYTEYRAIVLSAKRITLIG